MKKRILATILCLSIAMVAIGVPITQASAQEDARSASPTRWTNTATITLGMSYSGCTITSDGQILGNAGTSNISVKFTLEKLVDGKYKLLDSWSASSNSMLCSCSHKTSNCTAGTYKLTVAGTVTKNNYAEPIEYSITKTF